MAIHLALFWAFTYSCQASQVGRIWPTNLGFLQELHPVWPLPLHLAHPSYLDFLGRGCLAVAGAAPGFCIAVALQAEAAGLFMALPLPLPFPLPFPLLFLCPLDFFFNWSIACCSYSSKSGTIRRYRLIIVCRSLILEDWKCLLWDCRWCFWCCSWSCAWQWCKTWWQDLATDSGSCGSRCRAWGCCIATLLHNNFSIFSVHWVMAWTKVADSEGAVLAASMFDCGCATHVCCEPPGLPWALSLSKWEVDLQGKEYGNSSNCANPPGSWVLAVPLGSKLPWLLYPTPLVALGKWPKSLHLLGLTL